MIFNRFIKFIKARAVESDNVLLKIGKTNDVHLLKIIMTRGTCTVEDLFTMMWTAVENGSSDVISELLLQKIPFDNCQRSSNFITVLMCASQKGFPNIVSQLIRSGAWIEKVDYHENTALIYATRNGNNQCVSLLLQSNAMINHQNDKGMTALMMAVQFGWIHVAKKLLRESPELELVSRNGKTALMLSVWFQNYEMTELLLIFGANVNACGETTALRLAIDLKSLGLTKLLIRYGANVDQKDIDMASDKSIKSVLKENLHHNAHSKMLKKPMVPIVSLDRTLRCI